MSCPLALISTPPQSPCSKKPPMTLTLPMLPKSAIALRRTFTPASPCEAMPSSVGIAKLKSKTKLGKGCSLLDWIRLCRSKKTEFCCNDGTPRGISERELARHCTKEDAWTAIRGKYTASFCTMICMQNLTTSPLQARCTTSVPTWNSTQEVLKIFWKPLERTQLFSLTRYIHAVIYVTRWFLYASNLWPTCLRHV